MSEPKVAIVGTGRSGSGYIAALLNACGVTCGHEEWWNPVGVTRDDLLVDSSWCAVPFLDGWTGHILHQTRHPLASVASLLDCPDWGPYAELRDIDEPDPLMLAVRTVVEWNQRCEKLTDVRWQAEQVTPTILRSVGALAGRSVHPSVVVAALEAVPRTTNYHGGSTVLHWGDLPYNCSTVELFDQAKRYGYL